MIMIIILYDIYLHDYTYNYKCIYMIIPRIKAKQFSYFKQSSSFSMLETSSFLLNLTLCRSMQEANLSTNLLTFCSSFLLSISALLSHNNNITNHGVSHATISQLLAFNKLVWLWFRFYFYLSLRPAQQFQSSAIQRKFVPFDNFRD